MSTILLYYYSSILSYDELIHGCYISLLRLSEEMKVRNLRSIDTMRSFATCLTCRRYFILKYFEEVPSFDRCGTCDNCVRGQKHNGDERRDFTDESMAIFRSIQANYGKGVKAIVDGAAADVMYQERLLSKWRAKSTVLMVLKALISNLSSEGYVSCETKSFQKSPSSYSAAYTSHLLTPMGRGMLTRTGPTMQKILLTVPHEVREVEEESERKQQRLLEKLRSEKIDARLVPKDELLTEAESGLEGPWLKWHRSIMFDRAHGKEQLADAKEELFKRIMNWRSETAVALQMAPESVLQVLI